MSPLHAGQIRLSRRQHGSSVIPIVISTSMICMTVLAHAAEDIRTPRLRETGFLIGSHERMPDHARTITSRVSGDDSRPELRPTG